MQRYGVQTDGELWAISESISAERCLNEKPFTPCVVLYSDAALLEQRVERLHEALNNLERSTKAAFSWVPTSSRTSNCQQALDDVRAARLKARALLAEVSDEG